MDDPLERSPRSRLRRARARANAVASHSATTARSRSAAAPTRARPRTESTPTVSSPTMMGAARIAVARTGPGQVDGADGLSPAQGLAHGGVALARPWPGPGAGGGDDAQCAGHHAGGRRNLDRPRARPEPRHDQRQRRFRGGAHVAAVDPSRHVPQEGERQIETIVARPQCQRGPAKLPQRGRLVAGLPRQQGALLFQILRPPFVDRGNPADQQRGRQRPQLGWTGELRQRTGRRRAPGFRQKRERPPGDRHRGDQTPRAVTGGQGQDHQPDRMRAQEPPAEMRRGRRHRDRREHHRGRDGRFDHQAPARDLHERRSIQSGACPESRSWRSGVCSRS